MKFQTFHSFFLRFRRLEHSDVATLGAGVTLFSTIPSFSLALTAEKVSAFCVSASSSGWHVSSVDVNFSSVELELLSPRPTSRVGTKKKTFRHRIGGLIVTWLVPTNNTLAFTAIGVPKVPPVGLAADRFAICNSATSARLLATQVPPEGLAGIIVLAD